MYSGKLLEMGISDDVYNFGVYFYIESLFFVILLLDLDYECICKWIVY